MCNCSRSVIGCLLHIDRHTLMIFTKKKQSSQSKGTKKIAIAVMSRLNRTIFHLVLNNEVYDPKTVAHTASEDSIAS